MGFYRKPLHPFCCCSHPPSARLAAAAPIPRLPWPSPPTPELPQSGVPHPRDTLATLHGCGPSLECLGGARDGGFGAPAGPAVFAVDGTYGYKADAMGVIPASISRHNHGRLCSPIAVLAGGRPSGATNWPRERNSHAPPAGSMVRPRQVACLPSSFSAVPALGKMETGKSSQQL